MAEHSHSKLKPCDRYDGYQPAGGIGQKVPPPVGRITHNNGGVSGNYYATELLYARTSAAFGPLDAVIAGARVRAQEKTRREEAKAAADAAEVEQVVQQLVERVAAAQRAAVTCPECGVPEAMECVAIEPQGMIRKCYDCLCIIELGCALYQCTAVHEWPVSLCLRCATEY